MAYAWVSKSVRYVRFSGGVVRPRSPDGLSAKMDVVFDRDCDIGLLFTHDKVFKAQIISDFSFLNVATADLDVVLDAAVIFLGQDDTIKYKLFRTGLSGGRLGGVRTSSWFRF